MGDARSFEPTYCDDCTAPVILARVPGEGYQLLCGCRERGIDIDDALAGQNLLDPIGGVWSQLDPE